MFPAEGPASRFLRRLGLLECRVLPPWPGAWRGQSLDRRCREVRFRREAIRRCIGPGSASVGAVFGSFPAFSRAAERRLRPLTEREGILPFPAVDHEGVRALLAVAAELQRGPRSRDAWAEV